MIARLQADRSSSKRLWEVVTYAFGKSHRTPLGSRCLRLWEVISAVFKRIGECLSLYIELGIF